MAWLKGLPSLLVVTLVVVAGLWSANRLIPWIAPSSIAGPVELGALDDAASVVGFEARVPIFRPRSLGGTPLGIVAWRHPSARLEITWKGRHGLMMTQRKGAFDLAPDARPDSAAPGLWWWSRDGGVSIVLESDGVAVLIETDLEIEQALRVARSLRPMTRLR